MDLKKMMAFLGLVLIGAGVFGSSWLGWLNAAIALLSGQVWLAAALVFKE